MTQRPDAGLDLLVVATVVLLQCLCVPDVLLLKMRLYKMHQHPQRPLWSSAFVAILAGLAFGALASIIGTPIQLPDGPLATLSLSKHCPKPLRSWQRTLTFCRTLASSCISPVRGIRFAAPVLSPRATPVFWLIEFSLPFLRCLYVPP